MFTRVMDLHKTKAMGRRFIIKGSKRTASPRFTARHFLKDGFEKKGISMPSEKRNLGNGAENIVANYMSALGYRILARNFSVPKVGEIDIIAQHKQDVYFVEVKARKESNPFGGMEGCISARKLARIRNCADVFIQKQPDAQKSYARIIGAFVHIKANQEYENIKWIRLD